jgi:AbrB family looped-hinge helix DNA binding protein
MRAKGKITSKGQVTIPAKIREKFGLRPGRQLVFIAKNNELQVTLDDSVSPFAKYQGIGNPGIGSGREALLRYMRELRGHDDFD